MLAAQNMSVQTDLATAAGCDLMVAWGRGEDGQLGEGYALQLRGRGDLRHMKTGDVEYIWQHMAARTSFRMSEVKLHISLGTPAIREDMTTHRRVYAVLMVSGMGDAEDRLAPTSVAALAGTGISAIACGAEYSLAVSAAKQRVYAWGW